MGQRGPARTPLTLLETRGSRLPKREGRADVPHPDGESKCPAWVGKYGKQIWKQLYPMLRKVSGLMKPAYALDLALLCEAFNEMREAQDEIKKNGPTCMSDKGGQYQHPAVGRKNKAIARILKIGPRFGLNPADATRVQGDSGEGGGPADPFLSLMKSKAGSN